MRKISFVIVAIFLLNLLCAANSRIAYKVPFLCQAPEGKWTQPYEDACEEAAIIMAVHYVNGTTLNSNTGKNEILAMVNHQKKLFGGHFDLSVEKSLVLIRALKLNISAEVIPIKKHEDILGALKKGNILIVPAAGRMLNNPFYTSPGPVYHYLVITGFDDSKQMFITNDPGTKRGHGYTYSYNRLFDAIHDWTGTAANLTKGQKMAILIHRSRLINRDIPLKSPQTQHDN